ncbi:hypothetical protein KSA08_06120 [Acinetobacter pittii]|uniref:hypothetical protein n=1 Tax=Acinetobacter pittii TaxID=48296 RepID=UPI001F481758|nr:hypothetical protein [Acinetobacter pittii]MCE6627716.1 hypothetical protein [Acinetobacter pittii]
MTDLNKEREEFESDLAKHLIERDSSGFYLNDEIQNYWEKHLLKVQIKELKAELEKAKAQAVPETHTHSVTLTCAELKEAYDFGAPDESQEQMTDLVTIGWHENGHSGAGYYAYMTECEDEGSIKLGESESGAEG